MLQTSEELILASESPRRKGFLTELGLSFTICPAQIDESPLPGEPVSDYVVRMACQKARQVSENYPSAWILAADTIVTIDNELMGKPGSEREALTMLMQLAGRKHEVRTGYCLKNEAQQRSVHDSQVTEVRFAPFSEALARAYIRTGEPMDKAGSYGIQGRGGVLVESIRGSYSNVVGLPLSEIVTVLSENGIITGM